LRTAISEDPALAAAIEAKPELKNKLFANARLAERATRYDEIIGSPDEATVAVEGYTALGNMSDLLGQIEDGKPQSIAPFIEAMVERSALRDENGEVLRRQDGSIVTDGSVGKLLKNFFLGEMQAGIAEATAKGDDDALAAYDVVMERSGLRPSTANDDQSDELKSQREALEAERRQLTEQRERDASVATQAFEQRVIEATDKVLNGSIDSIVKRATGLSDFERTTVIRNIHNRLATLVGTNRSYKTQRATIERLPLGQKRQTEMTRLNTRFINDHLWTIATEALENAGHSITTKAEQRQQRQAAREESSRAENRGSLPLAQGGAQSGPDQQFSIPQIEADLKARNNGRTPSVQEILTEKVLRKQRAAAGGTR
jgi:hypothetical protein